MPTGTKAAPSQEDQAVAAVLDRLRRSLGVSQSALAAAAGISQPQVSRILAGQRAVTLTELRMMCDALGVTMTDVLGEAGL